MTELVLQDFVGGVLLRGEYFDGMSHFWNRLSNDEVIDLTLEQFGETSPLFMNVETVVRADVLAWPDTLRRYEHLATHVRSRLSGSTSA